MCCSTILLAKTPKQPDSYNYQRGVELVNDDNWDEGIEFLEKELQVNPKNGYAMAWMAAAYASKDERGTSIHYITEAQKYLPKSDKYYHAWTHTLHARLYIGMNDTISAIKETSNAIKIEPKNADWYELRGNIYRDLKQWKQSDADFEQYIQLTPGLIRGYLQLGRNLFLQERYEEALTKYQYAHLLAERSWTYSAMAECEVKLEKYENAVDHIIKALEMESYEGSATDLLISCKNEDFQEMLQSRLRAQVLKNPNTIDWHIYQIYIVREFKHYEDAIRIGKQIRKINPDPFFDTMLSDLYGELGDFNTALEYINAAIEADSTENDYFANRAYIYEELGNDEAMLADFSTLIQRQPDNHGFYTMRAGEYLFLGEYKKAIEDYDNAIALKNSEDMVRYMRARCLQYVGDTTKALKEFRRVLDKTTDPNAKMFAMASLNMKEEAMFFADSLLKTDSIEEYRYNVACVYALLGEKELALQELENVLRGGYVSFNHLYQDPDLQSIQGDELIQLIEKYQAICRERIARFQEENGQLTREEKVVEIPFTASNGVTKVDCTINGLPLNFIFDTGASDVTISQTEANFMYKNGYLSEKDIVGKQRYGTADGSVHVGTVFMIDHINFGGLELNGVKASVVENQRAPLLLGQTVLKRLGKIEIDNEKRVLKITTKQ